MQDVHASITVWLPDWLVSVGDIPIDIPIDDLRFHQELYCSADKSWTVMYVFWVDDDASDV